MKKKVIETEKNKKKTEMTEIETIDGKVDDRMNIIEIRSELCRIDTKKWGKNIVVAEFTEKSNEKETLKQRQRRS